MNCVITTCTIETTNWYFKTLDFKRRDFWKNTGKLYGKKSTGQKIRDKKGKTNNLKKCRRRREHPYQHCCTTKKKYREKNGKIVRKKKYGEKSAEKKVRNKKLRENSTGKKSTGKKIVKSHVTSGQGLFRLLLVKHAHGITSGSSSLFLLKCDLSCPHILLFFAHSSHSSHTSHTSPNTYNTGCTTFKCKYVWN
jgi:hypothetical protein